MPTQHDLEVLQALKDIGATLQALLELAKQAAAADPKKK